MYKKTNKFKLMVSNKPTYTLILNEIQKEQTLRPIEDYLEYAKKQADIFIAYLCRNSSISIKIRYLTEDIRQAAYMGLIKAYNGYNNKKKVKFSTYANIRIRGEMKDFLRSEDTISNYTRAMCKKVFKDVPDIKTVNMEELSKTSNTPVASLLKLKEIYERSIVSNSIDYRFLEGSKDPYSNIENSLLMDKVSRAIDTLTPREKHIIVEHFFKEKELKEIAKELEISQGRASQLNAQALEKIKQMCNKVKL